MADMEMKIGYERRECHVRGHRNSYGYFHRWAHTPKGVKGIVEWLYGGVELVEPEKVSFMDISDFDMEIFYMHKEKIDAQRLEELKEMFGAKEKTDEQNNEN